ncbi:MAG: polyphosphate polymerase domain-containing protein [Candidatus Scatosoma sp.]
MGIQTCFKRYEQKYLITREQLSAVSSAMRGKTIADEYGKSTICNIYFDTPDYRLIRRSLEKPVYKEKFRLRSYGTPESNSAVFLELKKKYDDVVYKRREKFTYENALAFLKNRKAHSQITEEIAYVFSFYKTLQPAVYLSYNREAFFGADNRNLRITFDTDILWRDYDLSLQAGVYGKSVLPQGRVLMEIKTDTALPLWLTGTLTKARIFKTSFSKYGTAYQKMQEIKLQGDKYA